MNVDITVAVVIEVIVFFVWMYFPRKTAHN